MGLFREAGIRLVQKLEFLNKSILQTDQRYYLSNSPAAFIELPIGLPAERAGGPL
jgi:hypothetical protein